MKAHHYTVSVQPAQASDTPSPTLQFGVANHDDMLAIAESVRDSGLFPPDDAIALAVGLKLFTGVMLKHRQDALFADMQPAVRTFVGNLKARVEAARATRDR